MKQPREEQQERWRGLLAEQKGSGQSVAVFCRERGVREWQFYEWKKRLRPTQAEPFVAVQVLTSPTPESFSPMPSVPIEIRLRNGHSLLVSPDFEASHLRRLLQVLEPEV